MDDYWNKFFISLYYGTNNKENVEKILKNGFDYDDFFQYFQWIYNEIFGRRNRNFADSGFYRYL